MRKAAEKFLVLALLVVASMQSQAAIVTAHGTDVDFIYDDDTLFGVGTAVGNSIFFNPIDFSATSLNGEGVVYASENLIIDVVVTNSAYDITSFAMLEQGDYIRNGTGASVTASGRLEVTSALTTCGIFACNNFSTFNVDPLTDTGGLTVDWSGGTSVDLADTAGWGSDTSVRISFQNNLSATTLNNGELATIQKKAGAVGLVVNPIPVPAAVWLFGSGLVALLGFARRR